MEVTVMSSVPLGPYRPAVRSGDYIFVSGQVGFANPETDKDNVGIEAQTKQCLENMKSVLAGMGSSLSDVVKVTVFLKNNDDFAKMNETYISYFSKNRPARSTIITNLINPKMLIEIECIVYCPTT